ncbi:hypothetical protein J4G07_14670, partial [Candidatus Poribacteria bacterium]|nr:hypothetical protein [Candidatus Poribacteria bacterium]
EERDRKYRLFYPYFTTFLWFTQYDFIDTIIASLQLQEVNMHTMQIVNQIADLYQVRLMVELVCFCFHDFSRITPLTPAK